VEHRDVAGQTVVSRVKILGHFRAEIGVAPPAPRGSG
jgi:hypothetical protein